jgi:tetratricopeptide (TPR) repeat protein
MRTSLPLLALASVVLLCACATTKGTGAGAPSRAQLKPPAVVTETTYRHYRDLYDALPVGMLGREAFRDKLLDHLLPKAERLFDDESETELEETFEAALSLYDATEVFSSHIRNERLAALAQRLVALFSPRGNETRVLLALSVKRCLTEDKPADQALFRRILEWMNETDEIQRGPALRGMKIVEVLQDVVTIWPSPFVLEELRKGYLDRLISLTRALSARSFKSLGGSFASLPETGHRIATIYLRVDRLDLALERLREFDARASRDDELLSLIEKAAPAGAGVQSLLALGEHFEERDKPIALRVCRMAQTRFPTSAAAHACVGRVAAALDRIQLAVQSFEEATRLAPTSRLNATSLAEVYLRRLATMIDNEQIDDARSQIDRIAAFYTEAEGRLKVRLQPPLSRVYYVMGQGFFNAGKPDLSTAAFERSLVLELSPEPLLQLATIEMKRERADKALAHLDRIEKIQATSQPERLYIHSRAGSLRAAILDQVGRDAEARVEHKKSAAGWQQWLELGLRPEAKAEAYVHLARDLFALDQSAKAIDALDQAIDVQPDRKETYADVIAILTTHGHLPEALDAYHRALGRGEVSTYLKSYCTFWIVGLARRAGIDPDPLAVTHLQRLQGSAWYTRLAKLVLGKSTQDELNKEARTVGEQAELDFYAADALLARGRLEDAKILWRKVIDSKMMAFYEYDMAAYNLRRGPATALTQPLDRHGD